MIIHSASVLFLSHFWVLFCLRYWLGATKTSINFSFLRKWIEPFDFPRTPGQAFPPPLNHFISKETKLCLSRLYPWEDFGSSSHPWAVFFVLYHSIRNYGNSVRSTAVPAARSPTVGGRRAVVGAAPFQIPIEIFLTWRQKAQQSSPLLLLLNFMQQSSN